MSRQNPESPSRLLAVRFSAFGNVVMLRPVLRFFCEVHPNVEITFLSRDIYGAVFEDIPGLKFRGINLKNYKGLSGIRRLAAELRNEGYTHYLDLHSVFRTFCLGILLGLPVFRIRKDRWAKFRITNRFFKSRKPVTHTTVVYADVFRKAGFLKGVEFSEDDDIRKGILPGPVSIGIAPMSRNHLKEWPLDRMSELSVRLARKYQAKIYVFGAKEERPDLEKFFRHGENIVAGTMSMADEIELLKKLSFMVSMDSGNMHLASVFGVPVVSIWGPTHPDAAFGPRGSLSLLIQDETLSCRPCSIYGQIPCYRRDHACMENLDIDRVFEEIVKFVSQYRK